MNQEPGTRNAAADRAIASMEGAAALPRRNGELVFKAPWEGRAFGMAVALHERRLYAWDEFRERLIAEIAADQAHDEAAHYYEQWLEAFERLLVEKGVVTEEELAARTAAFASGERDEVF